MDDDGVTCADALDAPADSCDLVDEAAGPRSFELGASFTLGSFLKDRARVLAIAAVTMLCCAAMLGALGVNAWGCFAFELVLAAALGAALFLQYRQRRIFYQELSDTFAGLENPSFLPEMVEEPRFLEGQLAHEALRRAISLADREAAVYRDDLENHRQFVELWIHEVKTPLAAARLTASKVHGAESDMLRRELERIESAVERSLYYARATSPTIDYELKEVSLASLAKTAVRKNANLLMECGVAPTVDIDPAVMVVADASWLTFILGQLISNSAKYGATTLAFTCQELDANTPRGRTLLIMDDNGRGIPAKDMPRVFERAFVGENGRSQSAATGMGLYFVALLAHKLGVTVDLFSTEGQGTRATLTFPHDRRIYLRKLQLTESCERQRLAGEGQPTTCG
ncbi:sensor histidine kinase [Adlercreutzia aquisgranensis]|uniref:sensor histidine kinase n=1 Tax=Adlercreutzia aquisgranensis TaxID=2941323 RepID=UPI00203F9331|nr:sensor histidine kinase [Adlercreutzia aquisgranensis]